MAQSEVQTTAGKSRAASLAAFAAVALVALAAVDLVLAVITPLSADVSAPRRTQAETRLDADLAILTSRNIFAGAPAALAAAPPQEDLPVTTLQLKLKSAVPGSGTESFAIIELPSNKQELFREDDTIMRGVRLVRIELYRAVISRNGVAEALLLDNRPERPSDIPVSRGIPVEAEGDADPDTAASVVVGAAPAGLQERLEAGATLADLAGPAFALFAQAGAEPGDVPVAVNGETVDNLEATWSSLINQAQQDGSLILTVQRGDVLENIILELPSGVNF